MSTYHYAKHGRDGSVRYIEAVIRSRNPKVNDRVQLERLDRNLQEVRRATRNPVRG